jgi:hypothetical protein
MRGQSGRIVFRRLLALSCQWRHPEGEQRSILLEHPKQALGTINFGVNRKHWHSDLAASVGAGVIARARQQKFKTQPTIPKPAGEAAMPQVLIWIPDPKHLSCKLTGETGNHLECRNESIFRWDPTSVTARQT